MSATYEWLYLPLGKTSHALKADGPKFSAECGISTWDIWYGTGRQSEYAKAAALPRCKKCSKLIDAR